MKLYGKNPVIERLRASPKSIRKIYIQEGYSDASYIRKKAGKWNVPIITIPRSKMIKIGRSLNTQGILADVEDFAYTPYEELLEKNRNKNSIIFLDNLNDPQNLGAIIRSLSCLGGFSVVLPVKESVGITESVLRVASGGDNYVPVAKVANLGSAIKKAQDQGFQVAGAVVKGGTRLDEVQLPYPLAVVIGSEQKGIRDAINKRLDLQLSIPMACDTLSFNVAHATAVFCYEITKQKRSHQKKQVGG